MGWADYPANYRDANRFQLVGVRFVIVRMVFPKDWNIASETLVAECAELSGLRTSNWLGLQLVPECANPKMVQQMLN